MAGCLGGFLLPFMRKAGFEVPYEYDFRVPGVTSISCDPHKYGFAPKGSSVIMFRTPELRHHMYSFVTEWTGGIYATPTILGSRPGGVVAATWAAMIHHGEDGYVRSTKQIVGAARKIGAAIQAMDGIELVGRPDVCVVAWRGRADSGINCYSLCDALKDIRGWDLATLQRPASVHLALTLPTSENADVFVADLQRAVQRVRDDPAKYSGGTAGIYGTASKMPASFVEESAKVAHAPPFRGASWSSLCAHCAHRAHPAAAPRAPCCGTARTMLRQELTEPCMLRITLAEGRTTRAGLLGCDDYGSRGGDDGFCRCLTGISSGSIREWRMRCSSQPVSADRIELSTSGISSSTQGQAQACDSFVVSRHGTPVWVLRDDALVLSGCTGTEDRT